MFSPHIRNNPASTFWTDDTNGRKINKEITSCNDVCEMQFMAMCELSNLYSSFLEYTGISLACLTKILRIYSIVSKDSKVWELIILSDSSKSIDYLTQQFCKITGTNRFKVDAFSSLVVRPSLKYIFSALVF